MKRILILTLGVIALATFISCKKDNDEQDVQALTGKGGNEQISTTLANSVWSSGRNGYQEETFVEFTDAENATYTIIENVDGTERLKQKGFLKSQLKKTSVEEISIDATKVPTIILFIPIVLFPSGSTRSNIVPE